MWENIKLGVVWLLMDIKVLRFSLIFNNLNFLGVVGQVGVVVFFGNFVVEIYFIMKVGEGGGGLWIFMNYLMMF